MKYISCAVVFAGALFFCGLSYSLTGVERSVSETVQAADTIVIGTVENIKTRRHPRRNNIYTTVTLNRTSPILYSGDPKIRCVSDNTPTGRQWVGYIIDDQNIHNENDEVNNGVALRNPLWFNGSYEVLQ